MSHVPYYPTILERLKTGEQNFLDLGCCFGQELRKLVADGAPPENLYGADLNPEFFDLGYKLFRDKDTLTSKFIAADIFDPGSELHELDGKIDILYAGSFLHLFRYEGQINACKATVKLLRDKKDSVLLGRQVGASKAGEYVHRTNKDQTMFRHNPDSFRKMWEEVGKLTNTECRSDFAGDGQCGGYQVCRI
jgi:SAM-dependent methyltransferase